MANISKIPREVSNSRIKTNAEPTQFSKMPGVYTIRNIVTNRIYIGSSKNLYIRYTTHCNNSFSEIRKKYTELYNDIRANPDYFIFNFYDWSEDYTIDDIREIEQGLLDRYFARDDYKKFRELTYNYSGVAVESKKVEKHAKLLSQIMLDKYKNGYINPKQGYITSDKVKQNIKNGLIKGGRIRTVYSYNLNTFEIAKHETLREASIETNVDKADVGRILKNQTFCAKGFYFSYILENVNDISQRYENHKNKPSVNLNEDNTYKIYKNEVLVHQCSTSKKVANYLFDNNYVGFSKQLKAENYKFYDLLIINSKCKNTNIIDITPIENTDLVLKTKVTATKLENNKGVYLIENKNLKIVLLGASNNIPEQYYKLNRILNNRCKELPKLKEMLIDNLQDWEFKIHSHFDTFNTVKENNKFIKSLTYKDYKVIPIFNLTTTLKTSVVKKEKKKSVIKDLPEKKINTAPKKIIKLQTIKKSKKAKVLNFSDSIIKTHNKETKEKVKLTPNELAEARKKGVQTIYSKLPKIYVYNLETNEKLEFNSVRQIAKELNITCRTPIKNCLDNKGLGFANYYASYKDLSFAEILEIQSDAKVQKNNKIKNETDTYKIYKESQLIYTTSTLKEVLNYFKDNAIYLAASHCKKTMKAGFSFGEFKVVNKKYPDFKYHIKDEDNERFAYIYLKTNININNFEGNCVIYKIVNHLTGFIRISVTNNIKETYDRLNAAINSREVKKKTIAIAQYIKNNYSDCELLVEKVINNSDKLHTSTILTNYLKSNNIINSNYEKY